MGSFLVGAFDMPYFSKHWPNYTPSLVEAVLLDFAKTFDSVVWDALDIGSIILDLGNIFVAGSRSSFRALSFLMFNGRPLAQLKGAGARQGNLLSPALFVIFIEPFLIFCGPKCRDWVSNVGFHLILLQFYI